MIVQITVTKIPIECKPFSKSKFIKLDINFKTLTESPALSPNCNSFIFKNIKTMMLETYYT